MNNIFKKISFLLLVFLITFNFANAKDFSHLKGKFLLQVEDRGRVWYVNPDDSKRYEITQKNALEVFKKLSLGINNRDLEKIPVSGRSNVRNNLRGKLLLQVEEKGRIWYVDFQGRKQEINQKNLFDILKKVSLGIKDKDLFELEEVEVKVPEKKVEQKSLLKKENKDKKEGKDKKEKPVKLELSEDENLKKFLDVWKLVKAKYVNEINYKELVESAINGMLTSLGDPYSSFMTEDKADKFTEQLEGEFEGIGIQIIEKDGFVTVVMPLDDSPALTAGIKAGDKIIRIDGIKAEGISLNEASRLIKGKKGTLVVLDVIRENGREVRIKVTRGVIVYSHLSYSIKEGVGYIKIESFGLKTVSAFKKAVNNLLAKNIDSLIIDVRDNPGGYLDSVIEISNYWLDKKIILQEKFKNGVVRNISSEAKAPLEKIETVVLVNLRSASASEILAGALQDHELATIVGVKSFGKGTVQEYVKLEDGSSVKVTIAEWLTPNGNSIAGNGIKPDVEVKISQEDMDNSIDSQLNKALELLK